MKYIQSKILLGEKRNFTRKENHLEEYLKQATKVEEMKNLPLQREL